MSYVLYSVYSTKRYSGGENSLSTRMPLQIFKTTCKFSFGLELLLLLFILKGILPLPRHPVPISQIKIKHSWLIPFQKQVILNSSYTLHLCLLCCMHRIIIMGKLKNVNYSFILFIRIHVSNLCVTQTGYSHSGCRGEQKILCFCLFVSLFTERIF